MCSRGLMDVLGVMSSTHLRLGLDVKEVEEQFSMKRFWSGAGVKRRAGDRRDDDGEGDAPDWL
jgi:hypothetical protein